MTADTGVGRSISTLIKNQGIGDLYELYAFTKRNGVDYNLLGTAIVFPAGAASATPRCASR